MNDLTTINAQTVGDIDRRTYLGGSDIAGVMGLSPWQTPLQVYERKTSGEPEILTDEKRRFFARRKRQEPVIAEMLFDEYGIEVTRLSLDADPNRYRDAEHPFMAAEIDFECLMTDAIRDRFEARPQICDIPNGTLLNGEIKTVHPFSAKHWGEEGSEDVPIHYAAQVMHGLGITKRPATIVAALFGIDNLLAFPVIADPETIAAVRAKAVAFWNEHVIPRIPPDPINMEDMMRLFARVNGRPVEADEDTIARLSALKRLRGDMAAMDAEKKEIEFQIADYVRRQWGIDPGMESQAVDDAVLMFGGAKVATWKGQSRTTVDGKSLAKKHPSIFTEYSTTSHFRVIRFPKGD